MRAIEKLREALASHDHYGAADDDAAVEIVDGKDNCYYQLNYETPVANIIRLGDLRALVKEYDDDRHQ